jgi:hypothetical protein
MGYRGVRTDNHQAAIAAASEMKINRKQPALSTATGLHPSAVFAACSQCARGDLNENQRGSEQKENPKNSRHLERVTQLRSRGAPNLHFDATQMQ